jgi:hypothetical protein
MSIAPTVGRVVLYRPSATSETFAAIVARVNDDDTVNLAVFNEFGVPNNAVQVPLMQPTDDAPSIGHFCHWMEYQIGQAAKTAELQTLVAATVAAPAVALTATADVSPAPGDVTLVDSTATAARDAAAADTTEAPAQ